MWETSDYTLHFESNPFHRHEQIILAAGTCDGFLPMTFLGGSHGLTVHYETGSYRPLSSYRIERTEDALYLMEKTLLILHTSPEFLLAPERILLSTDTVFYSKTADDLRIAFLPHPARTDEPAFASGTNITPFQRDLILFLAQLKQDLQDPHADFLLRLARALYYNGPATAGMLRTIGLLRRELDDLPKAGLS